MALTATEAAVNTAAIAYAAAVKALVNAYETDPGIGSVIQFVPADLADSAEFDQSHAQDEANLTTTFSKRVPYIVRGNGEFPIQINGAADGSLVPLVWLVTNSANDLAGA